VAPTGAGATVGGSASRPLSTGRGTSRVLSVPGAGRAASSRYRARGGAGATFSGRKGRFHASCSNLRRAIRLAGYARASRRASLRGAHPRRAPPPPPPPLPFPLHIPYRTKNPLGQWEGGAMRGGTVSRRVGGGTHISARGVRGGAGGTERGGGQGVVELVCVRFVLRRGGFRVRFVLKVGGVFRVQFVLKEGGGWLTRCEPCSESIDAIPCTRGSGAGGENTVGFHVTESHPRGAARVKSSTQSRSLL